MTPAQREKQRIAMLRLQDNPNIVLPPAALGEGGTTVKKPYYGKPKKTQKKAESVETTSKETPSEKVPEPMEVLEEAESEVAKESTPPPDDEPLDDWEMALDESVTPSATSASKQASHAKKDNYELESDDEEDTSSTESDDDEEPSEEESSSEDERGSTRESKEQIVARVRERLAKRREAAEAARSTDNLRSAVICVLGHVGF